MGAGIARCTAAQSRGIVVAPSACDPHVRDTGGEGAGVAGKGRPLLRHRSYMDRSKALEAAGMSTSDIPDAKEP